MPIPV